MLNISPKCVRVHSDGLDGFVPHFEFDLAEPLAWGDDVCVVWCTKCFPEDGTHPQEALGALFEGIRAKLLPARQAHVYERIQQGVVLMTADEVCKRIRRENSWLTAAVAKGEFPEPVRFGGRAERGWLPEEVDLAAAQIAATATAKASTKLVAKLPINDWQRAGKDPAKRAAAKQHRATLKAQRRFKEDARRGA